jgi:biotin carboxylase
MSNSANDDPYTLNPAQQVPVLPGSGLLSSEEEAGTLADGIGYPVLLKVRHDL